MEHNFQYSVAYAEADEAKYRWPVDPKGEMACHVECVSDSALAGHAAAWADLCRRALEPNVFLEPGFALPLLQHVRAAKGPSFLFVWERSGPVSFGRLLGLFPVKLRRGPLSIGGLARGLTHNQTSCGTPLVDRHRAVDVFDAMLDWLTVHKNWIDGLVFTGVAKGGAFHDALAGFGALSSRNLVGLGAHRRAVLRCSETSDEQRVCFTSAKRRKEHARQVRRLSEAGPRTYASARTPADVSAATERFLALEHKGWKGARGTALLADADLAAFTRAMTRQLAEDGKCRIDSIEINGAPVAMGIVMTSGDRAYFWKTTFDEAHAAQSPGVQFAVELTRAQLADPALALTDSCAVADHPMIDRVWADRMDIVDLILAVRPGDARRFALGVGLERVRRAARKRAKSLWLRIRQRAGD